MNDSKLAEQLERTTNENPSIPNDGLRLIRLPEVKNRVGLSRSTIYNYIASKIFPAPITLGRRSVAWLESDIDTWITDRLVEAGREVE